VLLEVVSGVAPGTVFSFESDPAATDFSAVFQFDGGTTIAADLQIDLGGGFVNYIAAFIAAAGVKAVNASGANPLVAGARYRFNYTTLTGTWNVRVASN
jgi:hypothetical protein